MDDKTKALKGEFVAGLKHYYNGDVKKLQKFANQMKALGFNFDDYDTLVLLRDRSEALIVLLGLSNFGVLSTVAKSVLHLQGNGNPDEYKKQYLEKFNKIKPPN